MKEKAKTTLLKAKDLKANKNAKSILNQFAMNAHGNHNATKTIEIKKKPINGSKPKGIVCQ